MAIQYRSDQQIYTGRGPLDAKSLVKTYAELLSIDTWTKDGTLVAYNGMLVAVWLDKDENKNLSSNNGVYYLFDPAVTSAVKKPDVTNVNNWYKISDNADISSLEARVAALETKETICTYGYRNIFPEKGEAGIMYIAVDEKKSYIWFNDAYLPIGGDSYEKPEIIFGGSAD